MVTGVIRASLIVSWDPPLEIGHNGMITGYVIELNGTVRGNVNSGTTHTISGLDAFVYYSVTVAAVNVNGTGSFSNPEVGRSGEDGKLNIWLCRA